MTLYENKSKNLLEAYDRSFSKLGSSSSVLDQLAEGDPVEIEVLARWKVSAGVGANQLHRLHGLAWRYAPDDQFQAKPLRLSFLLSSKTKLGRDVTVDVCALRVVGWVSRSEDALLVKSLEVLDIDEE